MGRKADQLRFSAKKLGAFNKPCIKEMTSFLNCLSLNNNNDDKCVRFKEQLNACMASQTSAKKKLGNLNYHLARLSRTRK